MGSTTENNHISARNQVEKDSYKAINSYHNPLFLVIERLNTEYVINSRKPREAVISLNGTQIAKIREEDNLTFKLINEREGREWILSSKVHGEFRPFSMSISELKDEALNEVASSKNNVIWKRSRPESARIPDAFRGKSHFLL